VACFNRCTVPFAAQFAIKDADMQLRLSVDALKPVVAG
jgi:hypothetical protein